MNQDCIFCKIIDGKITTQKLYEDDLFVVVKDISPKANVHCLAIPKAHYSKLADMSERQAVDLGKIFAKLPDVIANVLGLANGYRLIINQGEDAGQTVFHLHIHIVGGQKMDFNPA